MVFFPRFRNIFRTLASSLPSVSVCVHNGRSKTSAAAELAEFRKITTYKGTQYLMNTLCNIRYAYIYYWIGNIWWILSLSITYRFAERVFNRLHLLHFSFHLFNLDFDRWERSGGKVVFDPAVLPRRVHSTLQEDDRRWLSREENQVYFKVTILPTYTFDLKGTASKLNYPPFIFLILIVDIMPGLA